VNDIWRCGDGAAMCEFRRRTEQFGGSWLVPHCTHVIAQSMVAKDDGINRQWFGQSCLHFRLADEADPALRIEPAATTGELKRCDPPDKNDFSIGDPTFVKGTEESGEYDGSMSPEDLSVPILGNDDTEKETSRGSNPVTKSARVVRVRTQALPKYQAELGNEVAGIGRRGQITARSFHLSFLFLPVRPLRVFNVPRSRFQNR
jgi:hypothetical protein